MTTAALSSPKSYMEYYCYKLGFSAFILRNPQSGTEKELKTRKWPAVDWDVYQIMRPSKIQIDRWFAKNPSYNVAIVMGRVSGNAIGFDIDGDAAVKRIQEIIPHMSSTLRDAWANTMKTRTGSGGEHAIFKVEGSIDDISQRILWSNGQPHQQILMQGNGHYLAAAPSLHPNNAGYEWNGKELQTITRQELDEFIRLASPEQATKQSRPQTDIGKQFADATTTTTITRVFSPEDMLRLFKWIKPLYISGDRDFIIYHLSGAMRKDAGYSHEATRTFFKLLCNASGYSDEDLDKSLKVVDRTYRIPLNEINGKMGLHDVLVTSHEGAKDYQARAEAFSQICQIINGEPSSSEPEGFNGNGKDNDDDHHDNVDTPGEPGFWLAELLALDKELDVTDALVKEVMRRDRYKTLADTKEILWYHNGIFHYGGEDRINIVLEELGGCEVKIARRREVIERIKIKTLIAREEFDKDPLLRNVKNGIVNLETGARLPHDPEKYPSLIQIPHPYYTLEEMKDRIAARSKGSQFLCKKIVFEFLCNVMDASDVRLAIDYWGYCLIGDNRFQKDLMDVGPPDSGKSLQLNITKAFLGPKNVAHKTLKQLTENRFATADLYGKLANSCADISSARLKDIEAFKLIASGDDISAEKKNRDPFTFVPYCKLQFSANTPPLPNEVLDDAYYKRWILLVFGMKKKDFLDKSKEVKINRNMLEEIEQDENELTDLLHLAVQAAGKLVRECWFSGGQRTRDIDIIREEYLRKALPVKAWVEDNCVFGADYEGEKPAMFADFNEYCRKENLPGLASVVALGMKLLEFYPGVKDVKVGTRKERRHVWKGITLISKLRPEDQIELLGNDQVE